MVNFSFEVIGVILSFFGAFLSLTIAIIRWIYDSRQRRKPKARFTITIQDSEGNTIVKKDVEEIPDIEQIEKT